MQKHLHSCLPKSRICNYRLQPLMDGYEAASIIKTLFPSIPIIAQTAIYDKNNKDFDLSNLFNDYLVKPISINSLIEVLDKFLKTDN